VASFIPGFEHLDWLAGHNGRNSVLIDELRMPVAAQKHTEIVKPGDDTLQLNSIDEENCERNLILSDKVKKSVLKVLWPF